MKKAVVLMLLLVSALALPALAAEETRTEIDIASRPQMGPADAPVTIVEFLDFQ